MLEPASTTTTEHSQGQQRVLPGKRYLGAVILLALIFGAVGGSASTYFLARSGRLPLVAGSAAGSQQQITLTENSSIIDVVKKASPAVVSIIISKDLNKLSGFGTNPFDASPFSPFFSFGDSAGNAPQTPNVQKVGAGSGFFIKSDGMILTNKHVVADEQASYSVLTTDGKTYDAKVLTRDPVNDLAIVKIDIQNAPVLTLADSAQTQIGQRVVAIGNSLGQYQNTVTSGIVSGIGRSITAGGGNEDAEQLEGVIQTDAAINPGNSGGPLLNSTGQVIGINTAIDQQGQLVGFAIPSNDIQRAVASFEKNGKITRAYLGIRYLLITDALAKSQNLPRNYGAWVIHGQSLADVAVVPGSPAEQAGIVENDIILEVNGTRIDETHSLAKLLQPYQVGEKVSVKLFHRGEEKTVAITLGETK